jgi:putative transposon-encoded protein
VSFGKNGDIPVPADYNGDGAAEIAIFRPSTSLWAVKGGAYQGFGKSGDIPVPADYNGDGKTDIAIFRPSTGLWAIKGGSYQGYGKNGDTPLPKTSLYYYSVDSY